MKIAVDLRSIQTGFLSGVENYTVSLLECLLAQDRENQYVLFYNSFSKPSSHELHFINSTTVRRRIPSKVLNAGFKFLKFPKMEKLAGDFDLLFLPNANYFAISPKTKLAVTVHDLSPFITPEFYDIKRRVWHKLLNFKKTLERANIIFAVSEFTKKDIIDIFKIPESKIHVTPLGVNGNMFHPNLSIDRLRLVRNTYQLPGEFILYLGTLEPRKNVAGLVRAFGEMKTEASLVIAGRPGWKYAEVFREIDKSPKKRFIKVLGFVEEHDKPYLMKLARVFAFPSFYEGFGLPVVEAMSVGTPVLTSQITSLPEVTGDAALLVNPYNTGDIATGLNMLLTDEALCKSFIEKGLERAKTFTWEQTAKLVFSTFKDLQ